MIPIKGRTKTVVIGYAAADKDPNSRDLYVYSPELTPFGSPEIAATNVEVAVNTSDGKGGTHSSTLKTSNVFKATYAGGTGMSPIPPDVRTGEQVELSNYGDTDQWYWQSSGRDDGLRRCERKLITASASTENNAPLNTANTYFLEIDTLNQKVIRLQTSQADGEKHCYTFVIDAAASTISMGDEAGQMIQLDSENQRTFMKNASGSMIELSKQDITIVCEGNLVLKAGGNLTLDADGGVTLNSSGGNASMYANRIDINGVQ